MGPLAPARALAADPPRPRPGVLSSRGSRSAAARLWAPRLVVYGRAIRDQGARLELARPRSQAAPPLAWADWQAAIVRCRSALEDAAITRRGVPAARRALRLVGRGARRRARGPPRRGLPRAAARMYRMLSDQVDVFATEGADVARIERRGGGAVRCGSPWPAKASPGSTGSSCRRTRARCGSISTGRRPRGLVRPRARPDQGASDRRAEGHDELDDSAGGGLRFYDEAESRVEKGPGTRLDTREWKPPNAGEESRPLDWGGSTTAVPWLSYYQDVGAIVGAGRTVHQLRFPPVPVRAPPHAARRVRRPAPAPGGASTAATSGAAARSSREASWWRSPRASRCCASTASATRRAPGPDERYQGGPAALPAGPRRRAAAAAGELDRRPGRTLRTHPAPARARSSPICGPTASAISARRGFAAGCASTCATGRRPRARGCSSLRASFYPARVDRSQLLRRQARRGARSYVPLPLDGSVALRAGGQKAWGLYPFHEAAFIGSWDTVRGPAAEPLRRRRARCSAMASCGCRCAG